MFKVTSLITWNADVAVGDRQALIADAAAKVTALQSYVGNGLTPPSWRGGDYVWHLLFADRAAWEASGCGAALDMIQSNAGVATLDSAAYEVTQYQVGNASLTGGIYRALLIAVEPRATRASRREFAEDMVQMPHHVPEIVNWAMNDVTASRGAKQWTHVWEQEYAKVEDLTGPYLQAPYHLFHVDRWFDPEMPCNIIEPDSIRHSASTLGASIIARY